MKTIVRGKNRKPLRSGAHGKSVARKRVLHPQARFLTRQDRLAVSAFQKYLARELPNQIERIMLYGSKARGDADSESDLDLLIVTRPLEETSGSAKGTHERDTITAGAVEVSSKYGVVLSPLVREAAALENWTPLYDHIRKEGIELWRSAWAPPSPWRLLEEVDLAKKQAEHVQVRMALAQEKLAEAQNSLTGGFYNGTISNAYYAMFYASKAILLALGEDPHKHQGVVSLFGDKIVRVGLSDAKYGRLLSQAKKLREVADYEDFFRATREQAEESIHLAGDFVEEAKRILKRIEQSKTRGD